MMSKFGPYDIIPYGKFKGKTIADIIEDNYNYVIWLGTVLELEDIILEVAYGFRNDFWERHERIKEWLKNVCAKK